MAITWRLGDKVAKMTAQDDEIVGRHYVKWIGVTGMDSGDTIVVKESDDTGILFEATAAWNNYEKERMILDTCNGIKVTSRTSGTILVGL